MVGQAMAAEDMKALPKDDTCKGEISDKYKEHVEKLSEEFQKILRRYNVPHVIQAKLGLLGWNNAMDFGDRYSDIKEVIDTQNGAPVWLGFDAWEYEDKLKAAVHCGGQAIFGIVNSALPNAPIVHASETAIPKRKLTKRAKRKQIGSFLERARSYSCSAGSNY